MTTAESLKNETIIKPTQMFQITAMLQAMLVISPAMSKSTLQEFFFSLPFFYWLAENK